MYNFGYSVASADRCFNDASTRIDARQIISSIGEWVEDHIERGFDAFMMSFMFRLSKMDGDLARKEMHAEILRVYSRFLTEVVRNPRSIRNRFRRPILIASPDWPVVKRGKFSSIRLPHEGAHFGGILLVPPENRLKKGVQDHFKDQARAYTPRGSSLCRIDVKPLATNVPYVTDYVLKSLKRGRCTFDDVLLLPLAASEQPESTRSWFREFPQFFRLKR